MWHTGSHMRCSRSPVQFRSGPGDFVGPICSVSGRHTTPVVRWVGLVLKHFPFTNAASQWWFVNWFADSVPALAGFLRALWFPPTPNTQNPSIFLVHSFWSHIVCTSLLGCSRQGHAWQRRLEKPGKSHVTKKCKLFFLLLLMWVTFSCLKDLQDRLEQYLRFTSYITQ